MRIIYQTEQGLVVLIPSGNLDISEVARKDVPANVNYWIVEDNEIPSDREFRNAWELDENIGEPDGQGIGAEAWFAEKEVVDENPS